VLIEPNETMLNNHEQNRTLQSNSSLLQSNDVARFVFADSPRNEWRGFTFGYFWFSYFSGASPSCAEGRGMSG
jgi:hypothetical protein